MVAALEKWFKIRCRVWEWYDEMARAHGAEIDEAFENDSEIQAIIKEWEKTCDYDEDAVSDIEGDLYMSFADEWLVNHGYAFVDPTEGVLPIQWKSIPCEQGGEVFDPTKMNLDLPR